MRTVWGRAVEPARKTEGRADENYADNKKYAECNTGPDKNYADNSPHSFRERAVLRV